jgi:rhamnogalacturonan acetylesterase
MKLSSNLLSAILASSAMAIPTVYLAGDSTMAVGGGGTGTEGIFSFLPVLF